MTDQRSSGNNATLATETGAELLTVDDLGRVHLLTFSTEKQ